MANLVPSGTSSAGSTSAASRSGAPSSDSNACAYTRRVRAASVGPSGRMNIVGFSPCAKRIDANVRRRERRRQTVRDRLCPVFDSRSFARSTAGPRIRLQRCSYRDIGTGTPGGYDTVAQVSATDWRCALSASSMGAENGEVGGRFCIVPGDVEALRARGGLLIPAPGGTGVAGQGTGSERLAPGINPCAPTCVLSARAGRARAYAGRRHGENPVTHPLPDRWCARVRLEGLEAHAQDLC